MGDCTCKAWKWSWVTMLTTELNFGREPFLVQCVHERMLTEVISLQMTRPFLWRLMTRLTSLTEKLAKRCTSLWFLLVLMVLKGVGAFLRLKVIFCLDQGHLLWPRIMEWFGKRWWMAIDGNPMMISLKKYVNSQDAGTKMLCSISKKNSLRPTSWLMTNSSAMAIIGDMSLNIPIGCLTINPHPSVIP